MLTLETATNVLNSALGAGTALACLSMSGHMTRATRCAMRFGVFAMFVGALCYAFGGIWAFGDWIHPVFAAGVLMFLLANVRAPAAAAPPWTDRLAWLVIVLLLPVVVGALSS